MNLSNPKTIKRITAFLLAVTMILSALFMFSCSSKKGGGNTEVKHGKELKESLSNISDDDRSGYLALLDKYLCYLNMDYEGVRGLFPDDYWQSAPMTEDDFIADMDSYAGDVDASNAAQYGSGYEFYYTVVKEQNLSESIDEVQNSLSSKYGISADRVTGSYYLLVTFFVKSDTLTEGREIFDKVFRPVVIDGKWYLANELLNFGLLN